MHNDEESSSLLKEFSDGMEIDLLGEVNKSLEDILNIITRDL